MAAGPHEPLEGRVAVETENFEQVAQLAALADAGEDEGACRARSRPPIEAGLITEAAEATATSSLPRMSSKELCQKRRIFQGDRLLRLLELLELAAPARRMPAMWSSSMWLTITRSISSGVAVLEPALLAELARAAACSASS